MSLPHFKYHPDPLATGAIVRESATCPSCEQATDHVYKGPVYCEDEVEDLCPNCIANGKAAEKFGAMFCDGSPLARAGLGKEIIDEVTHRTPGFTSWQQEVWPTCCNDACEFRGDLPKEELATLPRESTEKLRAEMKLDDRGWAGFLRRYEPAGSTAIYKFVCLHCRGIRLGYDFE